MFRYGPVGAGWVPIVGDWDGDGVETIGLYDGAAGKFFLRNSNSAGVADTVFRYGPQSAGWKPVSGDWDGNGQDTVGLFSASTSTFYLRNDNSAGVADHVIRYGPAGSGWMPLIGDWDGSIPAAPAGASGGLANPFALLGATLGSSTSPGATAGTAGETTAPLPTSTAIRLTAYSTQTLVGTETAESTTAAELADSALTDLDLDPLDDALLSAIAAEIAT
jgi:hypothetical protein